MTRGAAVAAVLFLVTLAGTAACGNDDPAAISTEPGGGPPVSVMRIGQTVLGVQADPPLVTMTAPGAVASPDGSVVYSAADSAGQTILSAVDQLSGRDRELRKLDGRL